MLFCRCQLSISFLAARAKNPKTSHFFHSQFPSSQNPLFGPHSNVLNAFFGPHVNIITIPENPACMRVPKMVKNGFNSGLPVSSVFEEDKIPKEIKNRHEAQSRP
jgi:hypothetical protein